MKDLYDNDIKSLKKEIKKDIRLWRDFPCSCTGRINIVKLAILLKAIYRFNVRCRSSLVVFWGSLMDSLMSSAISDTFNSSLPSP